MSILGEIARQRNASTGFLEQVRKGEKRADVARLRDAYRVMAGGQARERVGPIEALRGERGQPVSQQDATSTIAALDPEGFGNIQDRQAKTQKAKQERMAERLANAAPVADKAVQEALATDDIEERRRIYAQKVVPALRGLSEETDQELVEGFKNLSDDQNLYELSGLLKQVYKSERTAGQKDLDRALEILNDETSSDMERAWAQQEVAGRGMTIETKADGSMRIVTGGGGELTTGARSAAGKKAIDYEEARGAVEGLGELIQESAPSSFGLTGQKLEQLAAVGSQTQDMPVVGGIGKWMLETFDDATRTKLRTKAAQIEGRLLPIITGDSRFTEGDVRRAREAIRILNSAGSKEQALRAYANLQDLLRKVQRVATEAAGTGKVPGTQASASPSQGGTSPDAELAELERMAREQGVDPEQVYQSRGLQ